MGVVLLLATLWLPIETKIPHKLLTYKGLLFYNKYPEPILYPENKGKQKHNK